jgi:hypothetical protein
MGLHPPEYITKIMLAGPYAREIAAQNILHDHRDWFRPLEQLYWYLKSFFFTSYRCSDSIHLEAFNPRFPLFAYSFSFCCLLGAIRLGRRWFCRRPLNVLAIVSSSLVIIHILSVAASPRPLPPRYMISTLFGYCLLAALGFHTLISFLRHQRVSPRIGVAVGLTLFIVHFFNTYLMLYTGTYYRTGGRILVDRGQLWAGNGLVGRRLAREFPSESLNRIPLICDWRAIPALISLSSSFHKTRNYHFPFPSLLSRAAFLKLCLAHHRTAPQIWCSFYHFAALQQGNPSGGDLDTRPCLDEANAFTDLFTGARPSHTIDYPGGLGSAVRIYVIDLSFVSNCVARALPSSTKPSLDTNLLKDELAMVSSKFIPWHPNLHLDLVPIQSAQAQKWAPAAIVLDFLNVSNDTVAQLKLVLDDEVPSRIQPFAQTAGIPSITIPLQDVKTSDIRKTFSIASLYNAIAAKHDSQLLDQKYIQYVTIRIVRMPSSRSSLPVRPLKVSLLSDRESRNDFLSDIQWIIGRKEETLFDHIEIPGLSFRKYSSNEVVRTCRLLGTPAVQRRVQGYPWLLDLASIPTQPIPRFLLLKIRNSKNYRFHFYWNYEHGGELTSIPLERDGQEHTYVIDSFAPPLPDAYTLVGGIGSEKAIAPQQDVLISEMAIYGMPNAGKGANRACLLSLSE